MLSIDMSIGALLCRCSSIFLADCVETGIPSTHEELKKVHAPHLCMLATVIGYTLQPAKCKKNISACVRRTTHAAIGTITEVNAKVLLYSVCSVRGMTFVNTQPSSELTQ